jgi:tetratricopeptide (TPR) repeat protein
MKQLITLLILIGLITACDQPTKGKEKDSQRSKTTGVKEKSTPETSATEMKLPEPGMPIIDSSFINPTEQDVRKVAMKLYNGGVDSFKNGKIDDALDQFKASIENYPENAQAYHYLGRIYFEKGQKGLSISYYKDAVGYNASDSSSTLAIGQVYFDMGDGVKAMEYYDKAVKMAPYFALAYYNRGTLLGMQKQYNSSLQDLNKSIEIDPSNGNAFVNRGLAYFYLKDMDKACESWEQAARMGMDKGMEAVELYCK